MSLSLFDCFYSCDRFFSKRNSLLIGCFFRSGYKNFGYRIPDPEHKIILQHIQVAENLLSNAMKYAPGSVVELSIRAGSPGYRQLRVEDRGPGISPARQRELFKPFTRLSDSNPDGLSSGLGLSLAKQILAGSGGQLWYEDREGGGARFVVELPVAQAESVADRATVPG